MSLISCDYPFKECETIFSTVFCKKNSAEVPHISQRSFGPEFAILRKGEGGGGGGGRGGNVFVMQ